MRIMKTNLLLCGLVLLLATSLATAEFYAITSEVGYAGTIWNETAGTGPWTTSTPRDGYLYVASGSTNYNILMSNWFQHAVSNVNDSFLQLYDVGNGTVTSATGGWDSTLKTFTVTVSGTNADYGNSSARFWQPDNGVAWGVNFTDYTYSFTALFDSPAVVDTGWYVNSDAPSSITGSFTGHFVVTHDTDKNPISNGDTYGFDIGFSKALFVPLDNGEDAINHFGAPVPVPGAVLLGMLGLGAAGMKLRKRA